MEDKYSILDREGELQSFWKKHEVNRFDYDAKKEDIYSIDTPPPTVSGQIHIGHIFSYTQAEVIARYKRMIGKKLFYPFGFDDNGLPTERLVEKEIGKKGSEMTRKDFVEECMRVTHEYRNRFQELRESMGFSVDWNLSYSTISPKVQQVSQTSFLNLIEKGAIYSKKAPSLWCPECNTAIAQAEIDKKEFPSVFYDIEFDLEDEKKLIISTTRPELMHACVGVFVNDNDERYKDLIGKNVMTPFGKKVKIIGDDKVDIAKGSGAVMCCSYGDETDMYRVKTYGLEEHIVLDETGKMIHTGDSELDGVYYKKARKILVGKLEELHKIVGSKDIQHDVGTHERCGTPVEILNVKQWFIKTIDIKSDLLEAGEKIKWHPAHMQKRYLDRVNNLKRDRCISRQRYFGIPIPVWYSKKTGEIILPEKEQLPVNPLTDYPAKLPEGHTIDDIYGEKDVLDTWATSSLTPLINADFFNETGLHEKLLPMTLRPQAHDIIRTWALYTIIMSHYHTGNIPFEQIMVSGHVLAPKGEKISKSKNNAGTTPEELIETYGADPVRYRACGGSLGKDIVFDEKEIEKGRKLVTKLWNAARYSILNLGEFDPAEVYDVASLEDADKRILAQSIETTNRMKKYLESFNVGLAVIEFEKFFWTDFCDNYLEMAKWKLLNPEKFVRGELLKKSSQYALYHALFNIIKLIAPVLPHITEEIYQSYFKQFTTEISIHSTGYPAQELAPDFGKLDEESRIVMEVIELIRKDKTDKMIKYGVESSKTLICGKDNQIAVLKKYENEIRSISRSYSIVYAHADELHIEMVL